MTFLSGSRSIVPASAAVSILLALTLAFFPPPSTAFGQPAASPTPFEGICPPTTSPQNFRTIKFTNDCAYDVWVGAQGAGVPAPMTILPGQEISAGGTKTWCVPSPCPSCAYFPATNCKGSGDSAVCETGLNRVAPVTAIEIAEGGTKGAPPNAIELTLPSPVPSPFVHFLGNGWIQPGSFALYSDAAETTIIAKDNGDGTLTGTAVAASPPSSIDYVGGIINIYFNSTVPATIYNQFSHLGTDLYDVSLVDGFTVPMEVSPTGTIPNAAEVAFLPEPCVTSANCNAGYTCSSNNQCVKTCSKDSDCGQYPSRCDTTLASPICVNSINTPYWCTSPGCTGGACLTPPGCAAGDYFCAKQAPCDWNFGSDFSLCPKILRVSTSDGKKVVGCNVPNDACKAFKTGGYDTATCSAPLPGTQGTCPSGTVCNAMNNGICYPTPSCHDGPNQQGSCPNPGQICTDKTDGICLDTFYLKDTGGCTGGPNAQGSCPKDLTCSAAKGGQCQCTNSSACPLNTSCNASNGQPGLCVGCQGHCPPANAPSCYGGGVCAAACSGGGQGNCPADNVCSPSGGPGAGGCVAGPSDAFTSLHCLFNYTIACAGSDSTCPPDMTCTGGKCISNNMCHQGSSCSSILDCPKPSDPNLSVQCLPSPGSTTKYCYAGCPVGDFSLCDPATLTCQPSNTGLYAAVGPANQTCQIKSGTYNSCFSEYDCFPGTRCDLVRGDPNEFTCIDDSSGTNAYNCSSQGFNACPGQGTTAIPPGTCGSPPSPPFPSGVDKCIAIGGHSCTKDSDCSTPMLCSKDGQCVWPPWCGGPLNPVWLDTIKKNAGDFETIFKAACPTTYTYQYDDPTSSFQCQQSAAGFSSSSSNNNMVASLGYQVTFCPKKP
jgi:hypothetical protein